MPEAKAWEDNELERLLFKTVKKLCCKYNRMQMKIQKYFQVLDTLLEIWEVKYGQGDLEERIK